MYTHTVTAWWPGQVIVLSYQSWPLCQSPRYDLHLHPFLCVFVCVTLRSLHGQTKKLRPLNCSHLSTVSCCRGCSRGNRVRDLFQFLLPPNFTKHCGLAHLFRNLQMRCLCLQFSNVLRADLGHTQKEKRRCHIQDLCQWGNEVVVMWVFDWNLWIIM